MDMTVLFVCELRFHAVVSFEERAGNGNGNGGGRLAGDGGGRSSNAVGLCGRTSRQKQVTMLLIGRWKMRKKWRERKVGELEGKRVGEWKQGERIRTAGCQGSQEVWGRERAR